MPTALAHQRTASGLFIADRHPQKTSFALRTRLLAAYRFLRYFLRSRRVILCLLFLSLCIPIFRYVSRTVSTDTAAKAESDSSLSLFLPDTSTKPVDVALIFDSNRIDQALQTIRSVVHYSNGLVRLHVVTDKSLYSSVEAALQSLQNIEIRLYDRAICDCLTRDVRHYSDPKIHTSAHCKLFLHEILPIKRVLYLDHDTTALQDIRQCYGQLGAKALFGMAVDLGETCQLHPNNCWPLGLSYVLPDGLKCGAIPSRFSKPEIEGEYTCFESGEDEPAQVNGGVILFELERMRKRGFTRLLHASTASHFITAGKVATWGEQEFINAFIRLHPETLALLPCGCNYQWAGVRRDTKCAKQSVVIAHAWSSNVAKLTRDPYNRLFYYFLNNPENLAAPPTPSLVSAASVGSPNTTAVIINNINCASQNYTCSAQPEAPHYGDQVFILTRTAGRPWFFNEVQQSVQAQTYPFIKHLVVTNDADSSASYLKGVDHRILKGNFDVDPEQVCQQCGHLAAAGRACHVAPPVTNTTARVKFFTCFCDTDYPANQLVNALMSQASSIGPGWILILDDDNLLSSPNAISDLMLLAKHDRQLLFFRSGLGRQTPSSPNFSSQKIIQGDVDASNVLFHSQHIPVALWSSKRWRSIRKLSRRLEVTWINPIPIVANPLRAAFGGLGMKSDFSSKVTVVVTSHVNAGFRPAWLSFTLQQYTSPLYSSLIDKVILVWNSQDQPVAQIPSDVLVLTPASNSLNARWTLTKDNIRTEAVLNLDDDVFVDKAGITCLLQYFLDDPSRLVGPFVRRFEGSSYSMNELLNGQSWSIVLPRILLLSKASMELYAAPPRRDLRSYVDEQEAHCDDFLLNMLVANSTGKAPVRVLLPTDSILDFYGACWPVNRQDTGGLSLQPDRAKRRSECFSYLLNAFDRNPLESSDTVGTCSPLGSRQGLAKSNTISPERWAEANKAIDCTFKSFEGT